jgi:assimilatory nitrate reductase electron transfer subunit
MRVVVIGAGVAGTRLATELSTRDRDGRTSVTLLGAEAVPGYNRALLCDVLAGRLSTSDTVLARAASTSTRLATRVEAVEPARRLVRVAGRAVGYDALVLATGSEPVLPPLTGLRTRSGALAGGVHRLATLGDYTALRSALPTARRAVVVGGGPLGVETAAVLAGAGLGVNLVHRHARLLPTLLDAEGAAALRRELRGRGVATTLAVPATRLYTRRGGQVTAVGLDGGGRVDADLVGLACGTRPRVGLARAAGLRLAYRSDGRCAGVAVDDSLRTSDPHIYAIGDCAAYRGHAWPHLATAWAQAAVLADRLTGRDPDAVYRGTPPLVRLRAGLDATAAGLPEPSPDDRVVQLADATRNTYLRLVVRAGRVAGLVAVGRQDTVVTLVDWYERAVPVPAQLVQSLGG